MNMGEAFANKTKPSSCQINIESLKKGLLDLKPTRQPTKIEIIRQLLDEIELMLEAGVTYADIAEFLNQRSVVVTEASLKSTLSKVRKEKKMATLSGNESTADDLTVTVERTSSDASHSEPMTGK